MVTTLSPQRARRMRTTMTSACADIATEFFRSGLGIVVGHLSRSRCSRVANYYSWTILLSRKFAGARDFWSGVYEIG
jgi:hypothetical protein